MPAAALAWLQHHPIRDCMWLCQLHSRTNEAQMGWGLTSLHLYSCHSHSESQRMFSQGGRCGGCVLLVAFSMFAYEYMHAVNCGASQLVQRWMRQWGGSLDISFHLLTMLPTFWTDALKEASASDRNVYIRILYVFCYTEAAYWSIGAGLSSLHSYTHVHMLTL